MNLNLKPGDKVWYSKIRSGGYWDGDFPARVIDVNHEKERVKISYSYYGKERIVWVDSLRLRKGVIK